MIIAPQTQARLLFLSRVVSRECRHLESTAHRLFDIPMTLGRLQQIEQDDDLSERVDAFVSRFSRLQDTLGDKLLPQLLKALGENISTVIDNLDKAEQLGWLTSSDDWMSIRQLRNKMVHDYIEDITILLSAIQTACQYVPELLAVAKNLNNELVSRNIIPKNN